MSDQEVLTVEELAKRQEVLEADIRNLSGEFMKITESAYADQQRFNLIEQQSERFEAEIRELKDSTRVMQRLFDQLGNKIDSLDTRLFTWLQKTQTDSGKERMSTQKMWITFAQYIIGGTVFAIVAALAAQILKG